MKDPRDSFFETSSSRTTCSTDSLKFHRNPLMKDKRLHFRHLCIFHLRQSFSLSIIFSVVIVELKCKRIQRLSKQRAKMSICPPRLRKKPIFMSESRISPNETPTWRSPFNSNVEQKKSIKVNKNHCVIPR